MAQKALPQKAFTSKSNQGLLRVLITPVKIYEKPVADPESGVDFNAIWDTGATNSCITKKVIDHLKLKPISIAKVSGAFGSEMVGGKTLSLKQDLKDAYNALVKAEEENDPGAGLLREEYEELLKHYQSLHDLHGKSRDPSALENKAVKAVAKNLKTAKDNILEYLPELADLMKDIKTGNTYGYFPSQPDKPVKISNKKQK